MSAHTPGPWRVDPDLSIVGKGGVTMSTGNAIGTADDYEWGYLRIEDARLIAAAPDLLAACQGAIKAFSEWEGTEEEIRAYAAIQAAITKAEGTD